MDPIFQKRSFQREPWEDQLAVLIPRIRKAFRQRYHRKRLCVVFLPMNMVENIRKKYSEGHQPSNNVYLEGAFFSRNQTNILNRHFVYMVDEPLGRPAFDYLKKSGLFAKVSEEKFFILDEGPNSPVIGTFSEKCTSFIQKKTKPSFSALVATVDHRALDQFLGAEEMPTQRTSPVIMEPLVESKFLRLFPDGTCTMRIDEEWAEICKTDLKMNNQKITTNSGNLLYSLIHYKMLFPDPIEITFEWITEHCSLTPQDIKSATASLQRSFILHNVNNKFVHLSYDFNTKRVKFLIFPQNKKEIEELNRWHALSSAT